MCFTFICISFALVAYKFVKNFCHCLSVSSLKTLERACGSDRRGVNVHEFIVAVQKLHISMKYKTKTLRVHSYNVLSREID